jgi:hypothetical protein
MQTKLIFNSIDYQYSQFLAKESATEIIARELRLPKHLRKNIQKFIDVGLIKDSGLPYSFNIKQYKQLNNL